MVIKVGYFSWNGYLNFNGSNVNYGKMAHYELIALYFFSVKAIKKSYNFKLEVTSLKITSSA